LRLSQEHQQFTIIKVKCVIATFYESYNRFKLSSHDLRICELVKLTSKIKSKHFSAW